MKRSDRKRLFVFGALSLVMLFFIYGQSLMSRQSSADASGFIVSCLKPLLDPKGYFTEGGFHHFIRKAGHFTEYRLLGTFFTGFYAALRQSAPKSCFSPLFFVLAVAVSDEYLQFFSGRGSTVTDVVLDFLGALTGLILMSLVGYLSNKRSKRNEAGLQ